MVEAVLKSSMGRMRRRSWMCMKQERERLEIDVVGEREERIKSNTKIADAPVKDVKVVEEELLDRCIEGSEIFLI